MISTAAVVCSTGLLAPQALAANAHSLDPVLSLDGGTDTTVLDPVADPGPDHPAKSFSDPCGVAVDAYGNLYVSNAELGSEGGGVIDVFDPAGGFITEVPDHHGPCAIAVDSSGRLYAFEEGSGLVVRYDPIVYVPGSGEIEYDPKPETLAGDEPGAPSVLGMGLDPSNDHLYVSYGNSELKFKFDELLWDGSPATPPFFEDAFANPRSLAILGASHDIYSSGSPWLPTYEPSEARVYVMDATTHEVTLTLDGSNTPAPDGSFGFNSSRGGVAVDQSNGDIYVDAVAMHHAVYQFDSSGAYVGEITLPSNGLKASLEFNGIAVDQGEHSPNQGYVYVTSGYVATNSHLYAFAPRDLQAPEIRNPHLAETGTTEALLEAELNPHGGATTYHFEYGPADCSANPCQSAPVPEASAGDGSTFKSVVAPIEGLVSGGTYHFRLVATNHCNPLDEAEACVVEGPDSTFSTFSALPQQVCPNQARRSGPSAALADCRAYELVSPPDTNGLIPTGVVFGSGLIGTSPVPLARADGQSVVFGTEGGTLPGSGGNGLYDTFRSARTEDGWQTRFSGLKGVDAQESYAGAVSPDHAYSLWNVEKGALAKGNYLRGPDGSVEPVGIGSQGAGQGTARWLSADAAHLIFEASTQLEPDAPPTGTPALYDRSPGGPTHVVSLLPGDEPATSGQFASYLGATDSAVAFLLDGDVYVRLHNAETLKVVDGPATYGGLADDGSRVFYVKGGNVFAFDTASEATSAIGGGGQSTMVNVSADGSRAYFVSTLVLDPEPNGEGAKALPGEENLYVWDAENEAVRFIATVTEEDVIGENPPDGGSSGLIGGLGLWTSDAVAPVQHRFVGWANDPSRSSPDGAVFAFESRARLTGYDSEGLSEVYRYDAAADRLTCVSCNPTGIPPTSDARLESRYAPLLLPTPPVNAVSEIDNLPAGGDVVLFQSADRLNPGDSDGRVDVYEWQADDVRACTQPAGCIRLISAGHSSADDYLYGASADGSSVFFLSSDTLVPEDADNTPSLYVARVDGGFAPPSAPSEECQGEACQSPGVAPKALAPGSSTFVGPGNPGRKTRRPCPRGKHRAKTGRGKSRCVKHHTKSQKHHPRAQRRSAR